MHVIVELWSNRPHLQQLLTGLSCLVRAGHISLEQRFIRPLETNYDEGGLHLKDVSLAHCRLRLEDGRKLYFDLHDGHEICKNALAWADVYYKRGFLSSAHESLPKVQAYGLNYLVYSDHLDALLFRRQMYFERNDWKRHLAGRIGLDRMLPARYILPRIFQCEQVPQAPTSYSSILFQTRLWNPADAPNDQKAAEWKEINQFRMDCVKALKDAYAKAFMGGIAPSAFARRICPMELLCDSDACKKVGYFELLKQASIGISTEGLHHSNGWKLAEYIAFSKPIVAELPRHSIPHGFDVGSNFLGFSSVGELLKSVSILIENPSSADEMARANWSYYQNYLQPEVKLKRLLSLDI